MPDTTPADEIRAAAEKLRELTTAESLTPGPWHVHNPHGYPQAVHGAGDRIFTEVLDEIDEPKIHAKYLAAMHPGVGATLADWFASTADLHEPDRCAKHEGCQPLGCNWCGDEDWPCSDIRHALAVARAINAA